MAALTNFENRTRSVLAGWVDMAIGDCNFILYEEHYKEYYTNVVRWFRRLNVISIMKVGESAVFNKCCHSTNYVEMY